MTFSLQILGTSAAIQANGRHQSAQVLQIFNERFLIDCGEGTQEQIKKRKINLNKIEHIFISHLHGDHFLGLFGLISTMNLLGRKKKMTIYGPKGLNEIITVQLKHSHSIINYPLNFIETNPDKETLLFETNTLTIKSFPLNHRIPCTGFIFKEKLKPRRIDLKSMSFNPTISEIKMLKKGESFDLQDGTYIDGIKESLEPKKSRSYAYCSDTSYFEPIIPIIKDCDLLYHESTFLDKQKDKAKATNHSTSIEAATIALKANASKLILGHFSARYKTVQEFETEARSIFQESYIAIEGEITEVKD